ncbi:DNA (cytosine-5-)-methyltransferase [uncultured Acetobacteroides sp.]|uniref:DNA (cytosine-5-)-methyltransferase n=1 Tax=uncultured Acetobacteroides sp. TaxID=1760811 RepID=UPI0029F5A9FD|nr:DNA (cytosine-5-)-methyltransferase [uncultured Acetobacteroides sp.]
MPTYSKVKEELKINVDKHLNDGYASVTHYWQNYNTEEASSFKVKAKEYLENDILSVCTDVEQARIPLVFDVPFPPPANPKFKFIDLFAGIGGFRIAFQNLGGRCVFSSEWNKYSQKTYEANFGEVPFGDITKIDESTIPDHDILIGGFPCQPFSIAGVSKKNALGREHGFKDKTQGTLFFDIVRIIEHKRPKAFLLENVKNLVSHDRGKTFEVIKGALKELNYTVHYQVLNGKHFVPQNRERILIVGFDNNVFHGNESFQFPEMPNDPKQIKNILEDIVESKYTLSNKLWDYLQSYALKHKAKGNGFGFGLVDMEGIARTMSARYYKDGAEILIPQDGMNPRRLTPRECARLQGYPKNFKIPVSDNQAYRQFGNSVVVPLMQTVGEKIIHEIVEKNGRDSRKSDSGGPEE